MGSLNDFLDKIICGDALEILKEIPDESIDLIITDPPYGVTDFDWDNFKSGEDLKTFTKSYLLEFDRILKNNSSCLIFWSQKYMFHFYDILKEMKTNLNIYKILVVYYPNVIKATTRHQWTYTYDFVLHLVKGDKPCFNPISFKGENKDLYIVNKPTGAGFDRRYHPFQKPVKFVEIMIKLFSNEGDIVLDPFIGSGTTAVACKKLKRHFIGIDINPDYCEIAERRLKEVSKDLSKILGEGYE